MSLDPETVVSLHHKLDKLKKEHKLLSDEIEKLAHEPMSDDLKIHRLKKEKLSLKDQMLKIETLLVPDIIA